MGESDKMNNNERKIGCYCKRILDMRFTNIRKVVDNLLPSENTKRWTVLRKAKVVTAVRGGILSTEEACNKYKLSPEELKSWKANLDLHGLKGLRTTKLKEYRV